MPDRTVVAIVNRSAPEAFQVAEIAVMRALEHLRVPSRLADVSEGGLGAQLAAPPGLIILGQPGLGRALSATDIAALQRSVQAGAGLLNLDGEFAAQHPGLFAPAMAAPDPTPSQSAAALLTVEEHFITAAHRCERVPFSSPVSNWPGAPAPGASVVLEDDAGAPLVIAAPAGEGRIVHFCCEPGLWTFEHLGHGCGLDDVFWRVMVWAARKPFAMLAMPPFVTARIDDASGTASPWTRAADSAAPRFAYIDELSAHGFAANVGLFIDDISDDDGAIIRAKWAAKQAQFSPHAFRDPGNVGFQIYMRHDGAEYSEDELGDHFARVDARLAGWEITPSRTLNSHYFECGLNALPFLRERGMTYMMTELPFGKASDDTQARAWFPRPYGHLGYILDHMPDHPDFFDAASHYVPPTGHLASVDFLHGKTVLAHESPATNIAGAVEHGAAMIARGLDNLVFGVLMTHEPRIACLSADEWRAIMHGIMRELEPYEKILVPYDEIADYARARHGVTLRRASYLKDQGLLEVAAAGNVDRELLLHVFTEQEGEIVRTFHRLPAGRDVVFQIRVGSPG